MPSADASHVAPSSQVAGAGERPCKRTSSYSQQQCTSDALTRNVSSSLRQPLSSSVWPRKTHSHSGATCSAQQSRAAADVLLQTCSAEVQSRLIQSAQQGKAVQGGAMQGLPQPVSSLLAPVMHPSVPSAGSCLPGAASSDQASAVIQTRWVLEQNQATIARLLKTALTKAAAKPEAGEAAEIVKQIRTLVQHAALLQQIKSKLPPGSEAQTSTSLSASLGNMLSSIQPASVVVQPPECAVARLTLLPEIGWMAGAQAPNGPAEPLRLDRTRSISSESLPAVEQAVGRHSATAAGWGAVTTGAFGVCGLSAVALRRSQPQGSSVETAVLLHNEGAPLPTSSASSLASSLTDNRLNPAERSLLEGEREEEEEEESVSRCSADDCMLICHESAIGSSPAPNRILAGGESRTLVWPSIVARPVVSACLPPTPLPLSAGTVATAEDHGVNKDAARQLLGNCCWGSPTARLQSWSRDWGRHAEWWRCGDFSLGQR